MKRGGSLAILLCLLALITACQKAPENPQPSSPEPTTWTTVNVLDFSIEQLLTQGQLEEMTGRTLRAPEIRENGTQLYALSQDGSFSLKINIQPQARSKFDKMRASFSDVTEAPNLGDTAVFVPLYNTLFAYGKGYSLDVGVSGPDLEEEYALLMTREIASALLEILPQAY